MRQAIEQSQWGRHQAPTIIILDKYDKKEYSPQPPPPPYPNKILIPPIGKQKKLNYITYSQSEQKLTPAHQTLQPLHHD